MSLDLRVALFVYFAMGVLTAGIYEAYQLAPSPRRYAVRCTLWPWALVMAP